MKAPTQNPAGKTVPANYSGIKTNTEFSISLPTADATEQKYRLARARLLQVNHWHDLCGPLSANFQLTDEYGMPVDHEAQPGDHIRIDLPAPGSGTGSGYDWVVIEKIEDRCTPSGQSCYIAMRVRPSENPQQPGKKIAHFYNEDATSSFVVERVGTRIRASVYGRNEKPNTQPAGVMDKLRNLVVAVGAMLGLHKPQWKSLVKGLLS